MRRTRAPGARTSPERAGWIVCDLACGLRGLVAVAVLPLAVACSALNEAYRDRVGYQAKGEPPVINLRCSLPENPDAPAGNTGTFATLSLRVPADADETVVGSLFRWAGGPHPDIPLVIRQPTPHQALARDVREILARNGYRASDAAEEAAVVLDLQFVRLVVLPVAAGWSELEGSIRAQAEFRATLQHGGSAVRQDHFAEVAESKVMYFLTSDAEATLNSAYCAALASFEQRLRSVELREAIMSHSGRQNPTGVEHGE